MVTFFSFCAAGLAAAQEPGPRAIVQSAERAVQDDSVATVRRRWTEALRRDSTDRGAALGLGSLARLSYDFTTAERFFTGILERAGEAVDEADNALVELQDSMLPVEVGDRELRADLAEVRTLVEALQGRAHQFVRTFGR